MGAAAPTQAQRKFAAGMAIGKSKAKAYALAHPGQKMKPASLNTAALRSSKSKAVQDELARLLAEPILQAVVLEPCPGARDPEQLREHACAVMLRLSRHTDALVAFHAACWLREYADAIDTRRHRPADERQAVLAELRGLYAKALKRPPIIEAAAEPAGDGAEREPESSPG